MSLLNDALRKKNRAHEKTEAVGIFQNEPPDKRRSKKKTYGLIALILFVAILSILGLWQFFLHSHAPYEKLQTAGRYTFGSDNLPDKPLEEQQKAGDKAEEQASPVSKEVRPQITLDSKTKDEIAPDIVVTAKRIPGSTKPGAIVPENKEVAKGEDGKQAGISKEERIKPKEESKDKKRPELLKRYKPSSIPKSEEPFYLKAVGFHRRNELQKAIQMYQEVLKKNPRHYNSRFNLASAYLKTSSFPEAHSILDKLNKSKKRNPQILLNLAIAEIGMGRPQKAISYLNDADALKGRPEFELCFHKGVALSKLGRLDESVAWYKKAEQHNPGHSRLIFNMAVVYDKLQKYQDSLTYYEAFLKNGKIISPKERTEVEKRIRTIMVYMARLSS